MTRVEARVLHPVNFGWGILGHASTLAEPSSLRAGEPPPAPTAGSTPVQNTHLTAARRRPHRPHGTTAWQPADFQPNSPHRSPFSKPCSMLLSETHPAALTTSKHKRLQTHARIVCFLTVILIHALPHHLVAASRCRRHQESHPTGSPSPPAQ